jgi:hypothetical protein
VLLQRSALLSDLEASPAQIDGGLLAGVDQGFFNLLPAAAGIDAALALGLTIAGENA